MCKGIPYTMSYLISKAGTIPFRMCIMVFVIIESDMSFNNAVVISTMRYYIRLSEPTPRSINVSKADDILVRSSPSSLYTGSAIVAQWWKSCALSITSGIIAASTNLMNKGSGIPKK